MVRFIILYESAKNDKGRYLHSNMVRFIIKSNDNKYISLFHIYIPIWLDLLLTSEWKKSKRSINLHSNMVRFIM